ncbi:unnamed protein product, partial [Prorocentrum cordatum]
DHVPIMLQMDIPRFSEQIQRVPRAEWGSDNIRDALRGEGDLKRDLLLAVEERLQAEDPRWTDVFFDYMNRVLVEAGQQLFRPGRKLQNQGDVGRCSFGPKKRGGRAIRVAQPSRAEWLEAWQAAGKSGGMSATEVDPPELIQSTEVLPDLTVEMEECARADIKRVSWAVQK